MLILTRRIGETLTIGKDIKVVVMAVNGSQVKVGIEAPKDVHVLRDDAKKLQKNSSAYTSDCCHPNHGKVAT